MSFLMNDTPSNCRPATLLAGLVQLEREFPVEQRYKDTEIHFENNLILTVTFAVLNLFFIAVGIFFDAAPNINTPVSDLIIFAGITACSIETVRHARLAADARWVCMIIKEAIYLRGQERVLAN